MSTLNNPMQLLKLLPKSNCGECKEKTCLAFAAVVANGRKALSECPYLESDILKKYGDTRGKRRSIEEDQDEMFSQLRRGINSIDFVSSTERLGAEVINDRLMIRVLGKNVYIDEKGNLSSEIHTHSWIAIPILSYIKHCSGVPVSGNWVPLFEN